MRRISSDLLSCFPKSDWALNRQFASLAPCPSAIFRSFPASPEAVFNQIHMFPLGDQFLGAMMSPTLSVSGKTPPGQSALMHTSKYISFPIPLRIKSNPCLGGGLRADLRVIRTVTLCTPIFVLRSFISQPLINQSDLNAMHLLSATPRNSASIHLKCNHNLHHCKNPSLVKTLRLLPFLTSLLVLTSPLLPSCTLPFSFSPGSP